MKTHIFTSNVPPWKADSKPVLLFCGILASLLYAAMITLVGFDGYSPVSQTVSELSAYGVPTRTLWIGLGFIYQILMTAFGIGVWLSAVRKGSLKVAACLILFTYGICASFWPFASMHQREVLVSASADVNDIPHLILAGIIVASNLATIGFGAASFGRKFRIYSVATILLLLLFGMLSAMDISRVGANLPTPLVGVWERINITGYLLWIIVLAGTLIRPGMKRHSGYTLSPNGIRP